MAGKQSAPSLSGVSYVTTIISTPGESTPIEFDSDDEFELVSLPQSSSSANFSFLETLHASLPPFTQQYPFEYGRRYHAFKAGAYPIPNDEREQDRMDLNHHIWKLVLGGDLISEIVREGLRKNGGIQRVLDVGTGTGTWAVDFADDYRDWNGGRGGEVQVVGNDLSPIQPKLIPPNCTFILDDFECHWPYHSTQSFDLIHARSLAGSVSSWPNLISSMSTHLEPGGWVELQECDMNIYSDEDVDLKKAPKIKEWIDLLKIGSRIFGKKYDVVDVLEEMLKDEGFVDVGRDVYEVPIGVWAQDDILNEVGILQRSNMIDAVEPYTLAIFTRVLKWNLAETKALMSRVKWELRDADLRLYWMNCE